MTFFLSCWSWQDSTTESLKKLFFTSQKVETSPQTSFDVILICTTSSQMPDNLGSFTPSTQKKDRSQGFPARVRSRFPTTKAAAVGLTKWKGTTTERQRVHEQLSWEWHENQGSNLHHHDSHFLTATRECESKPNQKGGKGGNTEFFFLFYFFH